MMWKATFIYGNQQVGARRCVAWVPAKDAEGVRRTVEAVYNVACYESIQCHPNVMLIPVEDSRHAA